VGSEELPSAAWVRRLVDMFARVRRGSLLGKGIQIDVLRAEMGPFLDLGSRAQTRCGRLPGFIRKSSGSMD